jgi:inner membrane protein
MGLAESLAQRRGHEIQRLDAKPSFGNSLLFKTIYETNGFYHVDSIRVGFDTLICEGTRIEKLSLETRFPDLDIGSKQYIDVERFRWFSDDYLAVDPKNRIFDMRYSMLPNEIKPMWGITLDLENPLEHVQWWTDRSLTSEERERFFDLLTKASCPRHK